MKPSQITGDLQFTGATGPRGHAIPTYNGGYGPLWVHRDSMGVDAIIRAQTWEEAYSIWEDEFAPDCDLSMEEIIREYGFRRVHVKIITDRSGQERPATRADYPFDDTGCQFIRWETVETPDPEAWSENELFCEAYGFRGTPGDGKGLIYAKDINGDALDLLDDSLAADLEISISVAPYDQD